MGLLHKAHQNLQTPIYKGSLWLLSFLNLFKGLSLQNKPQMKDVSFILELLLRNVYKLYPSGNC